MQAPELSCSPDGTRALWLLWGGSLGLILLLAIEPLDQRDLETQPLGRCPPVLCWSENSSLAWPLALRGACGPQRKANVHVHGQLSGSIPLSSCLSEGDTVTTPNAVCKPTLRAVKPPPLGHKAGTHTQPDSSPAPCDPNARAYNRVASFENCSVRVEATGIHHHLLCVTLAVGLEVKVTLIPHTLTMDRRC